MSLKKKDHGGDGEIGWRLRWLPYRVCFLQVALALTYSGQGKMYERLTGGGGWSGGLWWSDCEQREVDECENTIVSRNVEEAFLPKRNTTTSWDPSYILILVLVIQIVCCSHKLINKSRLLLRHSTWYVGILNMRARRCKGYTYMYCMALIKNSFKTFVRVKISRSNSNSYTYCFFFSMLIRVSILHRAHSIQSLSKCAYYVRAVNMEKEVNVFFL